MKLFHRAAPFAVIVAIAAIPFIAPLVNGEVFSFRDHSDYFVPLRYFTAAELRAGEIPLWNPYNGAGEPWLANPQTGVFYPPAWLFVVAPFSAAYVLFLYIHIAILGTGMFVLLRRCGRSIGAAVVGATVMMLAGPILSLVELSTVLTTFAWLPWAIWAALEAASLPAGVSALLLSMLFLGGEPLLALLGFAIFALIVLARGERLRGSFALLLGGAITAAQAFPFLGWLRGSERLRGLSTEEALRGSVAPWEWIAAAVSPASTAGRTQFRGDAFLVSHYIGALAFALAIAGVVLAATRRIDRRAIQWWALLLLACIAVSAGSTIPAIGELTNALHLNANRYPSKLMPVGLIALAAIACFALDALEALDRRRRATVLAAGGIAVAAAEIVFRSGDPQTFDIELSIGIGWIVVLTLMALQPKLTGRWPSMLVIAALLSIDFTVAARPVLRTTPFDPHVAPYDRVLPDDFRFARLLGTDSISGKRFDRREWLAGYLNLLDRKFDLSTAAPVVPVRFLELHEIAISGLRRDVSEWLSVGAVLAARPIALPAVARSGSVVVYRDPRAFSMATLWSGFVPVADDDEALARIVSGFDMRRAILAVRRGALASFPARPNPRLRGACRIVSLSPNRVVVDTRANGPVILSLNQRDEDGWTLAMDGRPVEKIVVSSMFRGAVVPAGAHRFVWSYRPRLLGAGMVISLAALVIALVSIFVPRRLEPNSSENAMSSAISHDSADVSP
jgi:hypothetical protein